MNVGSSENLMVCRQNWKLKALFHGMKVENRVRHSILHQKLRRILHFFLGFTVLFVEFNLFSNQIKSSCLSSITRGVVAQSSEPETHVLCIRAFRVKLEFRSAGFWGEGKTRVPGGKPLGAEKEATTNLAHIWSKLRIEPGPHWWEASALTTALALLLLTNKAVLCR